MTESGCQIVHAHLNTMNVFPLVAAKALGIPVRICHNHSTAAAGEGVKTWLKYLLRPWSCVVATDYFACGAYAGRWMFGAARFAEGVVHVMPNAIAGEHCAYSAAAGLALRRLGEKPLLDLGLRLGEGTGAALGFLLLEAAAGVYNNMATLEDLGIVLPKMDVGKA